MTDGKCYLPYIVRHMRPWLKFPSDKRLPLGFVHRWRKTDHSRPELYSREAISLPLIHGTHPELRCCTRYIHSKLLLVKMKTLFEIPQCNLQMAQSHDKWRVLGRCPIILLDDASQWSQVWLQQKVWLLTSRPLFQSLSPDKKTIWDLSRGDWLSGPTVFSTLVLTKQLSHKQPMKPIILQITRQCVASYLLHYHLWGPMLYSILELTYTNKGTECPWVISQANDETGIYLKHQFSICWVMHRLDCVGKLNFYICRVPVVRDLCPRVYV